MVDNEIKEKRRPWKESKAVRIKKEWVKKGISKMTDGTTVGPSGIIVEMLKASG